MKRRLGYVTGTRADYGLMVRTLRRIQAQPQLELGLCVTGMHLSALYGMTVEEICRDGLPIWTRIPVDLSAGDGAGMAEALAHELLGLVGSLRANRPDAVLVLGDRGEMLAGALASIHLNIPVVHIHGGERSGTVDEPVRHAISKLAHYHFTATAGARDRLIRMGEKPEHIFITGAPGLDGLTGVIRKSRAALCADWQLDPARPVALVIYHPILQTVSSAGPEMATILAAARECRLQTLCFAPNADAGNHSIRKEIEHYSNQSDFRLVTHLGREDYLAWLDAADLLLGNSSSGIIEAASFGLPVINIGNRQEGRERNANTRDVPVEALAIREAIGSALAHGRYRRENIYGDGQTAEKIVGLLSTLPLPKDLLLKSNAY